MMRVIGTISALVVAASGLAIPTSVSADEIALTLKAQGIILVGEFAGFEDDVYTLMTEAGLIYVPAVLVTCEGNACVDDAALLTAES